MMTKAKPQKEKSVKQEASKSGIRKLRVPTKAKGKLKKQVKRSRPKLTSAPRLFWRSLTFLSQNWKLFGGIVLVYFVLSVVLVNGFGIGSNLSAAKDDLSAAFSGDAGGKLATSLGLLAVLFGDTGTTASSVASAYRSVIIIVVSLAVIWALRQTMAGRTVTVKDAFYKGMYPLIPVLLVLLVFVLQLIPVSLASFIYGAVFATDLVVGATEQIVWLTVMFLLTVWSLYMVSSSLFALYIVTLEDTTPMQALRSTKKLVQYRRSAIVRKVLFLPLALIVVGSLIMLPIIWLLTPLAAWVFFLLSMTGLIIAHTYIYSLYRELL